jgi:hypothetical protein
MIVVVEEERIVIEVGERMTVIVDAVRVWTEAEMIAVRHHVPDLFLKGVHVVR